MAASGTATAALERARAETATCTYALWVPNGAARDTTLARKVWFRAIAEFGFEAMDRPSLVRSDEEWYMVGVVRNPRG